MKLFNLFQNRKIRYVNIICVCVLLTAAITAVRSDIYHEYVPIVVSRSVLESSVSFEGARVLENPGKIYVWENYLFVNEKYLGVHVLDNTDPSNPENVGFLKIPGNIDIAIKDGYLYADNAVDLITLDIEEIAQGSVQVTDRQKEVFPDLVNPDGYIPWSYEKGNRPEGTIIIGWKYK